MIRVSDSFTETGEKGSNKRSKFDFAENAVNRSDGAAGQNYLLEGHIAMKWIGFLMQILRCNQFRRNTRRGPLRADDILAEREVALLLSLVSS
jgi:hypothetical protein